jgi:hypothetical protein
MCRLIRELQGGTHGLHEAIWTEVRQFMTASISIRMEQQSVTEQAK